MSDLICGKHQYNGIVIGEPCPICTIEEETGKTDADEIERLKDRIEERDLALSGVTDYYNPDTQAVVSFEMIDAAVGWANAFPSDSNTFVSRWSVLAIFNIHHCTCNNGMYTEGNDDGSQTHDRECEVCNGRGWVVGSGTNG
jgi:hypothetical protein